jgi:Dyp-type peroxidase family
MISNEERSDIQGNILEGYGRYDLAHTLHVFGRFTCPGLGRQALARLVPYVSTAAHGGEELPHALNVGLSHAGLRALALSRNELDAFPQAFRDGMHRRAALLGDDTSQLRAPFDGEPVHVWLWLHGRSRAELDSALADLRTLVGRGIQLLEPKQYGSDLRNDHGELSEHFGFRDGISRTSIAGSRATPRPGDGKLIDDQWTPLAAGEFLLGHEDEARDLPALGSAASRLSKNGTFAVYRKLEQDVAAFDAYVAEQADKLEQSKDWIAARMVGRNRDGTPLIATEGAGDDQLNAFRFAGDPEGRVCPLGSHIRRANARDGHAFVSAGTRHRMVRRGKPYGEHWVAGSTTDRERGLLFVAINANLERQFEFIQRLYINDGAAALQGAASDPLVGARADEERGDIFVIPGETSKRDTIILDGLPTFVRCRGGEYFFLPGIAALTALAYSQVAAIDNAIASVTSLAEAGDVATLASSAQSLGVSP